MAPWQKEPEHRLVAVSNLSIRYATLFIDRRQLGQLVRWWWRLFDGRRQREWETRSCQSCRGCHRRREPELQLLRAQASQTPVQASHPHTLARADQLGPDALACSGRHCLDLRAWPGRKVRHWRGQKSHLQREHRLWRRGSRFGH